jgi:hypothetical protein
MPANHEYLTAFINNSATITEKAGEDIPEPAHKAVMYDSNGDVVLATSGDKAIGVILSDTLNPVKQGRLVNVLIRHIGLLEAGGAIAKGDPVTVNASGQGVAAASGDFIFGWAYTATVEEGECVQVQITRSGGGASSASGVQSVVAGTGITVNNSDPANPVISASA